MAIDMQTKRKIRLLFVTREEYPTFRPDICALFGKYLPRYSIYTSIIAKCANTENDWSGGEIICIKNNPIYAFFAFIRNAHKYDAIQVRDKIIFSIIAVVYSKLIQRPFFYWMSYPFAEDDKEKYHYMRGSCNLWKRVFYLFRGYIQQLLFSYVVSRLATHIFVQSDEMKRWLCQRDAISQDRMTVVPMGIDLDEIDNVANLVVNNQSNSFVIAYLGVINKLRMDTIFFDAIENILEHVSDVKIQFIGGGQEVGDEYWLADELELRGLSGRFEITGWLPREEAHKALIGASIGISVLRRNLLLDISSPTKVVEYAAFGIPSVVTDIPDQTFVITQCECGLSVPYNADDIATAVISLLSNRLIRERLARNGKEKIRLLRGYEIISKRLADTYQSLLC